ncbi:MULTISPECIES: hypothetical protein [unclassified Cryobacterium]|uniref:hypothetical protein n=1 Tax=unclassified Cryobacterium TaxID=2649013 RepID=UPI001F544056|nr:MULTISPECIES: hypothetical protein [unclassified Cryobacterium]
MTAALLLIWVGAAAAPIAGLVAAVIGFGAAAIATCSRTSTFVKLTKSGRIAYSAHVGALRAISLGW